MYSLTLLQKVILHIQVQLQFNLCSASRFYRVYSLIIQCMVYAHGYYKHTDLIGEEYSEYSG